MNFRSLLLPKWHCYRIGTDLIAATFGYRKRTMIVSWIARRFLDSGGEGAPSVFSNLLRRYYNFPGRSRGLDNQILNLSRQGLATEGKLIIVAALLCFAALRGWGSWFLVGKKGEGTKNVSTRFEASRHGVFVLG